MADRKRKLGLSPGRKTVVYTGRVNHKKGLDLVIAAAKKLPDIQFILVGSYGRSETETRPVARPQDRRLYRAGQSQEGTGPGDRGGEETAGHPVHPGRVLWQIGNGNAACRPAARPSSIPGGSITRRDWTW